MCLDFAGYFVFVVVVGLIDGELVWLLMVTLIVLFRRYIGCLLCDYICLLISMF